MRLPYWVCELEKLAAQFKDTNIASKQYQGMDRAGRLNDEGLNLTALVETAAEPAIEQIREIREKLAELQKYFEGKMGRE